MFFFFFFFFFFCYDFRQKNLTRSKVSSQVNYKNFYLIIPQRFQNFGHPMISVIVSEIEWSINYLYESLIVYAFGTKNKTKKKKKQTKKKKKKRIT